MDPLTRRSLPVPADGFSWVESSAGTVLICHALVEMTKHFFVTGVPSPAGEAGGRWSDVATAAGVAGSRLVRLRQVHGTRVVAIPRGRPVSGIPGHPEGDALVSDDPSIALAVCAADCVPALLADPRTGAAGAVHAGWRGTAGRAVVVALEVMSLRFGTRPADVRVALGPSIGPCCYEVGEDVREAFRKAGHGEAWLTRWFLQRPGGGAHLDLWRATADQMVEAGVPAPQIHPAGLCTATHSPRLPSYRREGPGAGRLAGVIRPQPPR